MPSDGFLHWIFKGQKWYYKKDFGLSDNNYF